MDLTTIDESVELSSTGNKSLHSTVSRQWSSPPNTTLFSMEESAPAGSIDQWQSFDSPKKKPPDINHSAPHLYPQPSCVTATKDNIQEEHDMSRTTVTTSAPTTPAVPPRPSAKAVANTVASFQDDFAPPTLPPRGKRADSDFMNFDESLSFDPFEDNSQNPSLAGPEAAPTTIALEKPPENVNFRRKVGGTSISRTPAFRRAKQNSLNVPSEPPEVVDNRAKVKSSDPTSMFDPLTNPDAVEVNSSEAESSKAVPSDDEELLRDWDFHKKTSYNCISTVPPTLTSRPSVSAVTSSPFFRSPLHPPSSSPQLRCKSANTRDYSQISRQRTIEADTTQRPGSSELFADLVDLHRGKSRTPSPQPKSWQAFQ